MVQGNIFFQKKAGGEEKGGRGRGVAALRCLLKGWYIVYVEEE